MSEEKKAPEFAYTKKDFASDIEVKWCPGCGDYSILAGIQKVLPEFNRPKEKFVFISGIGCSSRFPYYMNTYGFHTIHGRAPALASGVKIANPDLSVWVITGDGDALSIGGNHFIHALRRNVDINLILFNNRIYGLTKGQYSPTSEVGTKTKSSPYGSIDNPIVPAELALGANATFVARAADVMAKDMREVFHEAYKHRGASFVEILQNCLIFNDGIHKPILDKSVRDEAMIYLEAGKPMIFGAKKDKGLRINPKKGSIEVVNLADVSEEEILVHDPGNPDPSIHYMLSKMTPPNFPMAMGVIRSINRTTYIQRLTEQEEDVEQTLGHGRLMDLLYSGETWEVE